MAGGKTGPEKDVPARTRAARWLRPALLLSVTLNLLVAGLLIGAALNHDRDFRRDTALSDIGFGPFIAALPDEARRELGAELVAQAGNLRENRESIKRKFDELLVALRAEPFDAAQLAGIIADQDAKLRERQDIGRELLSGLLARMTPAERSAYADRLESGFRHGARMLPRDRRDGPPEGADGPRR